MEGRTVSVLHLGHLPRAWRAQSTGILTGQGGASWGSAACLPQFLDTDLPAPGQGRRPLVATKSSQKVLQGLEPLCLSHHHLCASQLLRTPVCLGLHSASLSGWSSCRRSSFQPSVSFTHPFCLLPQHPRLSCSGQLCYTTPGGVLPTATPIPGASDSVSVLVCLCLPNVGPLS